MAAASAFSNLLAMRSEELSVADASPVTELGRL